MLTHTYIIIYCNRLLYLPPRLRYILSCVPPAASREPLFWIWCLPFLYFPLYSFYCYLCCKFIKYLKFIQAVYCVNSNKFLVNMMFVRLTDIDKCSCGLFIFIIVNYSIVWIFWMHHCVLAHCCYISFASRFSLHIVLLPKHPDMGVQQYFLGNDPAKEVSRGQEQKRWVTE